MAGRRVPEDKREIFKEPIGSELKESELTKYHDTKIITVGDVVSLTMRRNGIRPILSVYDGYTERHEMTEFANLVVQFMARAGSYRDPGIDNIGGRSVNEYTKTVV